MAAYTTIKPKDHFNSKLYTGNGCCITGMVLNQIG